MGSNDGNKSLEYGWVAWQSIQSDRAYGVSGQWSWGLLFDRGTSTNTIHDNQSIKLFFSNFPSQDHACRSEGVDLARELDYKSAAAWVGHPYFDVIDNSTDFETKINRMLVAVCQKLGLDTGDRLLRTSRKLKFLGTFSRRITIPKWNCATQYREQKRAALLLAHPMCSRSITFSSSLAKYKQITHCPFHTICFDRPLPHTWVSVWLMPQCAQRLESMTNK